MYTTVYSKTNAGRLLAFEQKPGSAGAMRDLLKRVDGKTTYQQLIKSPSDAELFAQLCQQELVQVAPEPWRNSSVTPTFTDSLVQRDARPYAQASRPGTCLKAAAHTRRR